MRCHEVRLVREVLEVEHVCGVIHRVDAAPSDVGVGAVVGAVGEVRVGICVDLVLVLDRGGLLCEVLVVVVLCAPP